MRVCVRPVGGHVFYFTLKEGEDASLRRVFLCPDCFLQFGKCKKCNADQAVSIVFVVGIILVLLVVAIIVVRIRHLLPIETVRRALPAAVP